MWANMCLTCRLPLMHKKKVQENYSDRQFWPIQRVFYIAPTNTNVFVYKFFTFQHLFLETYTLHTITGIVGTMVTFVIKWVWCWPDHHNHSSTHADPKLFITSTMIATTIITSTSMATTMTTTTMVNTRAATIVNGGKEWQPICSTEWSPHGPGGCMRIFKKDHRQLL